MTAGVAMMYLETSSGAHVKQFFCGEGRTQLFEREYPGARFGLLLHRHQFDRYGRRRSGTNPAVTVTVKVDLREGVGKHESTLLHNQHPPAPEKLRRTTPVTNAYYLSRTHDVL